MCSHVNLFSVWVVSFDKGMKKVTSFFKKHRDVFEKRRTCFLKIALTPFLFKDRQQVT